MSCEDVFLLGVDLGVSRLAASAKEALASAFYLRFTGLLQVYIVLLQGKLVCGYYLGTVGVGHLLTLVADMRCATLDVESLSWEASKMHHAVLNGCVCFRNLLGVCPWNTL